MEERGDATINATDGGEVGYRGKKIPRKTVETGEAGGLE